MRFKIFYDELAEKTWAIKVIELNDRYGLDDCLTHVKNEPLVEFWDTRYPHHDLGQFVSRYNIATLLGLDEWSRPVFPGEGLNLCGHEPSWTISGACMDKIREWVEGCCLSTQTKWVAS